MSVQAATGVLSNDKDVDANDTLSASVDSGPTNGTVAMNADGSLTYPPNGEFSGTDSFTYKAFDGTGSSAATTVTLKVKSTTTDGFTYTVTDGADTTASSNFEIGIFGSSASPEVSFGTGAMSFTDSGQNLGSNGYYGYDVELGDFDGDGELDAIFAK